MKYYICQFARCLYYYNTADELNEHYMTDHGAVMPNMDEAITLTMYMDYSDLLCPCGSKFRDDATDPAARRSWDDRHRPHSNGFCRVKYDRASSMKTWGKIMKSQTHKF